MFRWLDRHGYDVDIWIARKGFQRFAIPLTTFREYLEHTRLGLEKAA